jgi:ComF family protein
MLLSRIYTALFPIRESERMVHAASYESVAAHYAPIPVTVGTPQLSCIALLPYHEPLIQAFVLEAKFHDNRKAQSFLGAVLATHLRTLDFQPRILPIPLSASRLRERGYNQVTRIAETACYLLKQDGLEEVSVISTVLRRTRNTLPQTTLGGAARRKNMANAFSAEVTDAAHSYVILDDVCTTGATLAAAAQALQREGIPQIQLVSLAH